MKIIWPQGDLEFLMCNDGDLDCDYQVSRFTYAVLRSQPETNSGKTSKSPPTSRGFKMKSYFIGLLTFHSSVFTPSFSLNGKLSRKPAVDSKMHSVSHKCDV